ncbi:hypothetical protein K8R47_02420 [archaeon]|nr:hypothetical protein [archaeon]
MPPRLAYKEVFIKYLDKYQKVAISGIIVSKTDSNLVIDDSTGNIQVIGETPLNINNYVRIFGSYIKEQNIIQAHLIQDLSKINPQLHKKIKTLLNT